MDDFKTQLRAIIKRRKLTDSAAAKIVGMDPGNFCRILSGQEGVTIERATRIVNALGATLCVKIKNNKQISVS